MKRFDFYPTNAAAQIIWLENFRNKLTGHALTLGLTMAVCAARIADARWLIYVLGSWLPAARAWVKACTEAARLAQTPDGPELMALPVFAPPPLPAAVVGGDPAVVPVAEGALDRIMAVVQTLKDADGFDQVIGADLGVVGAAASGPDMTTLQPTLKLTLTAAGVQVGWTWEGYARWLDLCELQVDHGQGWEPLAFDPTPGYLDTTPLPATVTKWKYRAIFRVGDGRVGQWSAVVEVAVGG